MLAPAESSIHRRRHCYRPFADAQDVGACHGNLYNTGSVHDQPATRESRLSVLRSCEASEHAPLTDPRSHERLSVEPSVWTESERSLTSEMGMVIVTNSEESNQQRPSSSKPGTGSPRLPSSRALMLRFWFGSYTHKRHAPGPHARVHRQSDRSPASGRERGRVGRRGGAGKVKHRRMITGSKRSAWIHRCHAIQAEERLRTGGGSLTAAGCGVGVYIKGPTGVDIAAAPLSYQSQ